MGLGWVGWMGWGRAGKGRLDWTGLVESKEIGWYLDGLGNKLVVWVVGVWFGVVLG